MRPADSLDGPGYAAVSRLPDARLIFSGLTGRAEDGIEPVGLKDDSKKIFDIISEKD